MEDTVWAEWVRPNRPPPTGRRRRGPPTSQPWPSLLPLQPLLLLFLLLTEGPTNAYSARPDYQYEQDVMYASTDTSNDPLRIVARRPHDPPPPDFDSLSDIPPLLPDSVRGDTDRTAYTLVGALYPSDSVKCYSCMSSFYKGLWPRLSETYNPPLNFSDTCDKDASQRNIGLVDCPSICIKMWEETIIGGFTRGCYDTMLRRGFNQTLVRWYRWLQRDSCHYYQRKDVLQLPFNMPGHIYICTCYSDGCNGRPSLAAATLSHPRLLPLTALLLLLRLLS